MVFQPRYVAVPRFRVDDTGAADYLSEHGFVAFQNILSPPDVAKALDLLWDYLEALGSGLDRNDAATWAPNWPPTVGDAGILAWFGIGQSEFMWFVRTRPNVRAAFAHLWRGKGATADEADDLLCSLDGATVWLPGQRTRDGWLHVDQHPVLRRDFCMLQGFLNLLPVQRGGGGNVVVKGSHADVFSRLASDYAQDVAACGFDYFEIPHQDAVHGMQARQTVALLEAGDLLVWDSRTVHCTTPANSDSGAGLTRAVAYVTWAPREGTPEDVLSRRRESVARGETTTHWPTKFQPTNDYEEWAEVSADTRFTPPRPPEMTPAIRRALG
ncbi:hypothetical protein M885DRAFT_564238 [Pelagophyceae sp. CCMP2097]|nr:hypothetical protein M885DRAFT_564238 [Pelagophyceae sp. CCMP2097]|mmetsp:Transcript_20018/g.67796  ORF Transcript_20018/g.67796 Transcript_20018/m.67796 type:complete len:327 (+) Transcript_20018:28-1008(+)